MRKRSYPAVGDGDKASRPEPMLLVKWRAALCAAADTRLSAGDLAVFLQLADRFNAEAGAAWPSWDRLGQDTNRARATVVRSLKRLESLAYIRTIQRGMRNRAAARYWVNFTPTGVTDDTSTGIEDDTSTGIADDIGLVSPTTPKPLTKPVIKPAEEVAPAPQAAPGAGRGSAPGAPPPRPAVNPDGCRFPDFWAAYPKRQGVHKAEQEIARLIDAGEVTLPVLIDGARRYGQAQAAKAYPSAADRDRFTKSPINWLTDRRWLDDFPMPTRQAAGSPKRRSGTGTRPRAVQKFQSTGFNSPDRDYEGKDL